MIWHHPRRYNRPGTLDQTAHGHQIPFNTQFSVFLDNKVGKLLELVEVFDGQHLRLVALSVLNSSDHAVVRLVTSYQDLARNLLTQQQLPFTEAEILIVELEPKGAVRSPTCARCSFPPN